MTGQGVDLWERRQSRMGGGTPALASRAAGIQGGDAQVTIRPIELNLAERLQNALEALPQSMGGVKQSIGPEE